MERRGDEHGVDAAVAESFEIGAATDTASGDDFDLGVGAGDPGAKLLGAGPLTDAHAGEVEDEEAAHTSGDDGGDDVLVIVAPGEWPPLTQIEGEDEPLAEFGGQDGNNFGAGDGFQPDDDGAEPGQGSAILDGTDAGIDPEIHVEGGEHRVEGGGTGAALDGVEIGQVEFAQGEGVAQGAGDAVGIRGWAELALDGAIQFATTGHATNDPATQQVEYTNDTHGDIFGIFGTMCNRDLELRRRRLCFWVEMMQ